MVKVPPAMSSTLSVPSRAFLPSAAMPFSIPANDSLSALRKWGRRKCSAQGTRVSPPRALLFASLIRHNRRRRELGGLSAGTRLGRLRRSALAEDGHDEALGGADSDGDVVEFAVHDVGAVDDAVHRGHLLERGHGRLDKGGHEAQLHAVLLDEGVLVVVAQLHDPGHVNLQGDHTI